MKLTKHPYSALKFIARIQIDNPLTQGLLDIIVTNRESLGSDYSPIPRASAVSAYTPIPRESAVSVYSPTYQQWGTTDADFYALLGTPNGRGIPELLTKYANIFATKGPRLSTGSYMKVKTISEIRMA